MDRHSGLDFCEVAELGELVSKDADFSHRIIAGKPPPRIIHIRIGNMRLKEFENFIDKYWDLILEKSETHKLVNVFRDRVEGVE